MAPGQRAAEKLVEKPTSPPEQKAALVQQNQRAVEERIIGVMRAFFFPVIDAGWKLNKLAMLGTFAPCWPSCVPPAVRCVCPTPATAAISFPGTPVAALDELYIMRRYTERSVALPDGRRLSYYTDGGDAAAMPVLLLHGMGAAKYRWMQRRPIKGARLVAIDRPGYGSSSPPPDCDSDAAAAAAIVSDVVALLDALGIRGKFGVCGHSAGCVVAMVLAAALPERVCGVLLVSPPRRVAVASPPRVRGLMQHRPMWRRVGTAWALQRAQHIFGGVEAEQKATPARFAAFAADAFWVSALYDSQRAFVSDHALAAAVAADSYLIGCEALPFDAPESVRCAVHVVSGAEDKMTPRANGELLQQKVPHATLETMEGAAHFLAVGPTEDFRRILESSVKAWRK